MKKRSFDWRSFISFTVAISALVLFVSGVILYIAPSGRVAHWTDWKIIFGKDEWTDIHVVFSVLFTVAIILHLFKFNWKVFKNFLKKRGVALGLSLLLSTVLLVGTYYYIPPFVYVRNFSDYMKDYWERKTASPPIPHAEELTLREMAEKHLKISVPEAMRRLKDRGLKVDSAEETLKQIGERNGLSPLEIYNLLSSQYPPQKGGGFGRMTLSQAASNLGISVEEGRARLEKNGIKVSSDALTLREIADRNGMRPREIYELLEGK